MFDTINESNKHLNGLHLQLYIVGGVVTLTPPLLC